MTKRKVALLCGEYPVLSETFVWREVEALRQSGYEVCVATLRQAIAASDSVPPADLILFEKGAVAASIASLVTAIKTPLRSFRVIGKTFSLAYNSKESMITRAKIVLQGWLSLGLASALKKQQPEWLHCHFAHAPATYTMLVATYLDLPWSFTGHANDIFQRRILLAEKLDDASGVACISDWHKDFYTQINPDSAEKLTTIRCGVDVQPFRSPEKADNEQALSIIAVGRLIEKKGFRILLEACRHLADVNSHIDILVVGDGPQKALLEQTASQNPDNVSVTFYGAAPHNTILSLVEQADLFVMPCISDPNGDKDGIPVSMMEAMAAGVPVLAGDLPAIRELIHHDKNGWLIHATPENVAGQIKTLIKNKHLLAEAGANARAWVAQEFSTTTNIKRLTTMMAGEKL